MQMKKFTAIVAVALFAAMAKADVTGKITFTGKPPQMRVINMTSECAKMHADPVTEETVVVGDGGELQNVIVSVENEAGNLSGPAVKSPAVLDQKGCVYVPHVLAMMTGQELVVKNSDPCLHNVHSLSADNPFNMGQPGVNDGQKIDPQPQVPGVFAVKCDIHPWMKAWIAVFDHPFFSVSGEDGTYTIKNLPDGTYTMTAWHELYGSQEQKLVVKDGKATANFTFNSVAAQKNKTGAGK